MGNFQLPRLYGLNASGDTLPGALLYFYDAGTTTPITIYQDEANLIAHTNPLVADGDGRFAPVWVSTAQGAFKAELRDADNVLIWTEDNLKPYGVAGGAATSNPTPYFYPADDTFNAAGDGVTDDTAAIQSAITAAEAQNGGGTVDLGGLLYRVDSQLTIPGSDVSIVNGTLDFSASTDDPLIVGTATKQASVALLNPADTGDISITLVAAGGTGMAAGDLLQLTSGGNIFTATEDGELVRIASVAGDVITLSTQLVGTYASGTVTRIDEADILQNITFRDLNVRLNSGAASSTGIRIDGGRNITFDNVTVYDGATGFGIETRYCEQVAISDCHMRDLPGSGIKVSHSCRDVSITACGTQNCGNGIDLASGAGGIVHSAAITNCKAAGGTIGILVNTATTSISIIGCTAEDNSSAGIRVDGTGATLIGNNVNRSGSDGIQIQHRRTVTFTTGAGYTPASTNDEGGYVVSGNVIRFATLNGIEYTQDSTSVAARGVSITDNAINGCGGIGVLVDCLAEQGDISVANNRIRNTTGRGIWVDANAVTVSRVVVATNFVSASGAQSIEVSATAAGLVDVDVSHNRLAPSIGADAVLVSNADDVIVANNRVSISNAIAIELDTCTYAAARGNIVKGAGTIGIQLEDCSRSSATLNRVDSPSTNGIKCLATTAGTYTDLNLSGNQVNGPGEHGIYVHASGGDLENVRVDGAQVDVPGTGFDCIRFDVAATRSLTTAQVRGGTLKCDTGAGEGVYVDGDNATACENITIAGVSMTDGGIEVRTATRVTVEGCTVASPTAEGVAVQDCNTVAVTNNKVNSTTSGNAGIYLYAVNADLNDATVSGNVCASMVSEGIHVESGVGDSIRRVSITGNTVNSSSTTANAIYVQAFDVNAGEDVTIANNVALGGRSNIRAQNTTGLTIVANRTNNANDEAVYVLDSSYVTVNSNSIDSAGDGNGIYIFCAVTDMSGVSVCGNTLNNCRIQCEVGTARTMEQIAITGNTIHEYEDRAILLFGSGVSSNIIQFFNISGNNLRNTGGTFVGVKLHASGSASIVRTGLVTGNNITSTSTTGKGIFLENVSGATLDDIAMTANFIKLGTGSDGIELNAAGTNTQLAPIGNVFSMASGEITETAGTFDFTSVSATDTDRNATM